MLGRVQGARLSITRERHQQVDPRAMAHLIRPLPQCCDTTPHSQQSSWLPDRRPLCVTDGNFAAFSAHQITHLQTINAGSPCQRIGDGGRGSFACEDSKCFKQPCMRVLADHGNNWTQTCKTRAAAALCWPCGETECTSARCATSRSRSDLQRPLNGIALGEAQTQDREQVQARPQRRTFHSTYQTSVNEIQCNSGLHDGGRANKRK